MEEVTKTIEEMARTMCLSDFPCACCSAKGECIHTIRAKELYNAGYRKLAQAPNSPDFSVSEDNPNKNTDGVRKLIEGLARGDCKGVKGATVYKIQQYAEETGLI